MKFQHQINTDVSKTVLWALLEDFPRAASCAPGLEEVQQLNETSYECTGRVRVGPIRVRLSGTVELQKDEEKGYWRLQVQAQDRRLGGEFSAIIEATVTEPTPGKAKMDISVDAQLMGRLGQMGQPLIKRKADSMVKEFAENLSRLLAEDNLKP